ncbi:uncharacterized protein DMAD_01189 [Drosophila madeirensis]|uniref:Ubiquitin-like protease family profile domain-containing protein n=1 Tax=Drosophila madeirensis TaxID=30013 RepID=A0AAU9G0H1_DROMD
MSQNPEDFGPLENAQDFHSNSHHLLSYGPNPTPILNQARTNHLSENNGPQYTQQHTVPHCFSPQSAAVKFGKKQQTLPQKHPIEPEPSCLGAIKISGNTAPPYLTGDNFRTANKQQLNNKPNKISKSCISQVIVIAPLSKNIPRKVANSVNNPTRLHAAIEALVPAALPSLSEEHHFTPFPRKNPEDQEEELSSFKKIETNPCWLQNKNSAALKLGETFTDFWHEQNNSPSTSEEEEDGDDFGEVPDLDSYFPLYPCTISIPIEENTEKIIEDIADPNHFVVEFLESDEVGLRESISDLSPEAEEGDQEEAQSLSNEAYPLEALIPGGGDTFKEHIQGTLELPEEGLQFAVEHNLQSRQPTAEEEYQIEQQPDASVAVHNFPTEALAGPEAGVEPKSKRTIVKALYQILHVIGSEKKRPWGERSRAQQLLEISLCQNTLFNLLKDLKAVPENELSAEELTPLVAFQKDIEQIEQLEGDSMGLNLLHKLRNLLKSWTRQKDETATEVAVTGDGAQGPRNEAAIDEGTLQLKNRTTRKRSGGKRDGGKDNFIKYRRVESTFPRFISQPIAEDMPTTSESASFAEQESGAMTRMQIPSSGNKRLSIFNEPRTAHQVIRYHGVGNNIIELSDDDEPPVHGFFLRALDRGRTGTASSAGWGPKGQSSSHGDAAVPAAAPSSLVRPSLLYADAVRLGQNGYTEQTHTNMNGHHHHPHHSHSIRGSPNHDSLLMRMERLAEREQYVNFVSDVAISELRKQTSRTNPPPLLPMASWAAMVKKNPSAEYSRQVQKAKKSVPKPTPPPQTSLQRQSVFELTSTDSNSGSGSDSGSSPPVQVAAKGAPQPVIIDLDSSSNEKPAAKGDAEHQKNLHAMQQRFSENIFFRDDYEQKFRQREQRERTETSHQRELASVEADKLTEERRRLEGTFRWSVLDYRMGCLPMITETGAEQEEVEQDIEFIPISEEQQRELHEMVTGDPDDPLIRKYSLIIAKKDIRTLTGLTWLNDEVINFYMNLIIERSEQKAGILPSVYAMNTFFLSRLLDGGFSAVRRWTRRIDLISKDIIVVPVHFNGMHWCMAIIHMKNKTIFYYDSLGNPNNLVLEALKKYIQEESLDKRRQPLDVSGFRIENIPNGPQQTNGSDCGVFSCMTAEYITRDKPLTFSQEHMPYFRKKMMLEIVHGQLWK